MKEHPILFSGPMVRAILDGRKTQTRRVVKPQPKGHETILDMTNSDFFYWQIEGEATDQRLRCPYGQPGDELWVRETWKYEPSAGEPTWGELMLAKKEPWRGWWPPNGGVYYRASETPINQESMKPWRPSIFMHRELSRLTLRVTGVRVERVQEITEADAIAEGTQAITLADAPRQAAMSERQDFSRLWDPINAKRGHSWESNPWVWAVSFEVKT